MGEELTSGRVVLLKHEIVIRCTEYLIQEFEDKHLSDQIRKRLLEYKHTFSIAPRKYDTAEFLLTSSNHGKNPNGIMLFLDGSYANELDRKGSEFFVYKKKDPIRWLNVPMKYMPKSELEQVLIRPHNHKNYAHKMLRYAIIRFGNNHKDEVEEIVWQVM